VFGDHHRLRVELVAGDQIAGATLDDTPQARALAAMLPVSVEMDDPFGQVKAGPLPRALRVDAATRSRRYTAGDLAYWPPSGKARPLSARPARRRRVSRGNTGPGRSGRR